ncbi:glutathione S-transferase N-terminal domain-containing protein [Epibacterium ulvae]|uniref:glutathione S-transferase N-terminal domain-containing protein n=1 Tax=Epibacterium ulvae TaxID=1156985 RepID=UPI00249115D7|nr:glutathione S-transferase N-terminal domain-containing protein [Epibacterium ulvae]
MVQLTNLRNHEALMTAQDPIHLYYWPTPNGWKVSIALEEFALPYEVTLIDIGKGDQFAPDFLEISPNNRMPAITDPNGPDGAPINLFESGAILQYLARKTGQFYGSSPREQIAIDQWLMWQMGGVGPMAGQAHHFLKYAPDPIPYAKNRYRTEVARLYGVLDRQLAKSEYVAGDSYSIADMAIWPWASLWEGQEQSLDDKPHLARWLKLLWERPALRKGRALSADLRKDKSDTWVQDDLKSAQSL